MNERQALLSLSLVPGLGAVRINKLLETFKSPLKVLLATPQELKSCKIPLSIVAAWQNLSENDEYEKEEHLAAIAGVSIVTILDPDYPTTLKDLPNPPPILYVKGSLIAQEPTVAIVGTRQCSMYGKQSAFNIGEELARRGITVVSGLARGIDTEAHLGALKSGRTLAFTGSGFCHFYPQENLKLSHLIAKHGAVVSEYSMETKPDRHTFPARNRLIAAYSTAVILIEAPLKSGAIITMEWALKLNRKRFVLPGKVDMDTFKGGHQWIKEGKAQLFDSIDDLLALLPSLKKTSTLKENSLHDLWGEKVCSIEELANLYTCSISEMNQKVMRWVLEKKVIPLPGGLYRKAL